MKKLLLLVLSATSMAAYALPTYEPFTEFYNLVATTGSNMVAATVTGIPLTTTPTVGVVGSAADPGGMANGVDLATGGLAAPTGESWTSLNFSGINTSGTTNGMLAGVDIALINNPNIFTYSSLTNLLPTNFPGYPPLGGGISTVVENPAQQQIYQITSYTTNAGPPVVITTNYGFAAYPSIVGNSAVLKFSAPLTRPTTGTKTLYWSYLFNIAQQGQTGAGNVGRYLGFLNSSNLVEGTGTSGAYKWFGSLFNTFGTTTYFGNGVFNGNPDYIQPPDSSAGKDPSTPPTTFPVKYVTNNYFIVGEFVFTTNGSGTLKDTNLVWVNPATNNFGGSIPPASPVIANPMGITMHDVGGMVLIDRPGSGQLGGAGTNYIANLLIGTTWSYVTGGPEFTNLPQNVLTGPGLNVTLSSAAVAAGQNVTYQWYKIVGSATNMLSDGSGTAGGNATVAGSGTNVLTLTGVSSGDYGTFEVVATAGGTGYTLPATATVGVYTDPDIISQIQPVAVTTNYGGVVTFTANVQTLQPPLTYAWYNGSTPVANGLQGDGCTVYGATGSTGSSTNLVATLILSNVTYLEDGSYTLAVTNNQSSGTTLNPATLTVIDPYIVTQPPFTVAMPLGGTSTVSVAAAGSGVTYQWWSATFNQALGNGGALSGVTTSNLTITGAQYTNADTYYLVVNGSSGQPAQSSNTTVFVDNTVLGPYSPTDAWPPCIATNSVADYCVFDPNTFLSSTAPPNWNNVMSLPASAGDQTWTTTTYAGFLGRTATGTYFNFADPNYAYYLNVPLIDILIQVYGNGDMYDVNGNGLPTTWTEGTLNSGPNYAHASVYPLGANNGQWNWMLLTVTNPIDPADGFRYVGDIKLGGGSDTYGGVNSGTLRLEGFTDGMTIRAVATGPHGAFGFTNQVNRFATPANCPAQTNNLAYVDFNYNHGQGITNYLTVMNNAGVGETYTLQSGVGPANDLRTAIQSSSGLMEFPILSNYLGQPCNPDLTMQLCVEFYDDPVLAGSSFGPYQFATDAQGDLQPYTGAAYTLTGSGQWLKVAFYVGPANLEGVNTAPLTGGPQVIFNGSYPYIDRVELGVILTGTNALAGQTPDPSYYINPLICSTNYGYYAEWNPSGGVTNNVDIAGGYATALEGPSNDKRLAEVASLASAGAYYFNFSLLNSVFGPGLQDNADVVMTLTYYDDPAQVGSQLFPNTYNTWIDGSSSVISPSAPYNTPVTLLGSNQWKDAQFELPNVNFTGANVCRFATYSSTPLYVSRVRFDVIRPCGPFEGIDYLQSLGMANTNSQMNLNWRGSAALQSATVVTGAYASVVTFTNILTNSYSPPMTNKSAFFRLQFPSYPPYLSTNTP